MQDPQEALRISARRLAVVELDGGLRLVFGFRRIRSSDLMAQGFLELLGSDTMAAAQEAKLRRSEREGRLAAASSAEDRARLLEEFEAADHAEATAALSKIDKAQAEHIFRRAEAMICAAVELVGYALPGIPEGLLARSMLPQAVCVELPSPPQPGVAPYYLKPLRVVATGEAAPGIQPIADLGDDAIIKLSGWIMLAMQPDGEVTSFRP